MKKGLLLITLAAMLAALSIAPVRAQMLVAVKGKVTDENGPMAGVKVEYYDKDTGRKYTLTTNKNGEFFSVGVQGGTYQVTLTKDGQPIWTQVGVPVSLSAPDGVNEANFNLPELRAAAMSQPGTPKITAEQLKKIEEAKKENASIEVLNQKLAAAKAAEDAQNWDQAVAILNEATTLDPTRHELWANLCVAELGGKKYEDASGHCQKAVALAQQQQPSPDPIQLAHYHNELGQAYAKTGKTQEAVAEYTSAAQADPGSAAKYYYNLGAILTNAFKADEAVQAFDKAIAADPNYADAYYWKATNLINKATVEKDPKTGKDRMVAPAGTAEAYQKYLALKPDGQFAQAAKDVLTMIGAEVQTTFGKQRTKK